MITGGNRLKGEIEIEGAKNAALPLMAASLLADGKCCIKNVPALTDVKTMCKLLMMLGAECTLVNKILTVDPAALNKFEAPYELVKTMRASIYVLGPLLAKFGRARVSLPGGCAWGPRPVNLHLEGMKTLGAEIDLEGGYIVARAERLIGNRIALEFPSVGATGNLLMAAVLAKGETVIENAAREPDITAVAEFLIKIGAKIEGVGSSHIFIQGVDNLQSGEFDNIPDRIEAGTFMIAGAITGGKIRLNGCNPHHCKAVTDKLLLAGCEIIEGEDWVELSRVNALQPVNLSTEVYPGFPTDLQAQWIALMSIAPGVSRITETIYPDRFTHVAELMRLGANIRMSESKAFVTGVPKLKGAQVMSTDIRASASLILAGLSAEGTTEVSRVYHIDRGYYRIEEKFSQLGADIKREKGTL